MQEHNTSRAPIDLVQAAKYLRRDADQNHCEAQNSYALCLENGRGVSLGLAQAAKYCQRAADQNHARAQDSYGLCLENGRGVKIDLVKAAQYF